MSSVTNVPFVSLSRAAKRIQYTIHEKITNAMFTNTDYVQGKDVEMFEIRFAEYIGTKHCCGVANGTDALEIAIESLSLPSGSEIITQANTYAATAFAITNTNNDVKFIDVDAQTLQMDLNLLEQNITDRTKAIIIVHLYGGCCDMEKLMKIASKHNLCVIEDCSQAHGAKYKNKNVGTFGDVATFSFYPTKNLGAFGDAGAICSNREDISTFSKLRRNQGGLKKYEHSIVGRNSRLDTIQAIVLREKLLYLNECNKLRRKNAFVYRQLLEDCKSIRCPELTENSEHVYHLFVVRAQNRDALLAFLKANGISAGIHYPTSLNKIEPYLTLGFTCENSESAARELISLPMFPELTHEEIQYVCSKVKSFYTD